MIDESTETRGARSFRDSHLVIMQVIPLDQFPRSLSGLRRFQTAQRLWDEYPDLRPELALGLKRLCRAINGVVSNTNAAHARR